MLIQFKKLHPNAVLPTYAYDGDAGLDLTVTRVSDVKNGKYTVWFGLAVQIPKGYFGAIVSRSSIHKRYLKLSNGMGVVDCGYRGEISAVFYHDNEISTLYKPGDVAAQMVILPCPMIETEFTDDLAPSERGDRGYGSSDSVK